MCAHTPRFTSSGPFRLSSRAPHRTGAMAHDLADILACQAESGARGQRMEAAQTTGVAECGEGDRTTSATDAWKADGSSPNPCGFCVRLR